MVKTAVGAILHVIGVGGVFGLIEVLGFAIHGIVGVVSLGWL